MSLDKAIKYGKEIKKEEKYKKDISYGYPERKNYFSDYDNTPSEFEIEIMRERMNR